MMLTAYLFYSFFGYLSGSVLYSYLIPKYFCHVDVRTVNEDQNPGAFNAFSVAGPRIGLLCVLCDIGKGFLPVFLAAHSSAVSMSSWIFALILLAPVAGHAWPFLQPAKGGKAISVSFGVLLGLLPDLFHEQFAALLGQRRDRQENLLAVVRGGKADIGIDDRLFDRFDHLLVPRLDQDRLRIGYGDARDARYGGH